MQIYLCQPQYKGGEPDSHRQFWRGAGTKYSYYLQPGRASALLASSFNSLLADAIDRKMSHLLMLHDDIVPDNGYGDILLDVLGEEQAKDPDVAMVSAVVPIKDWMGLTSTAIDWVDGFAPERRITMTEVFNLPETFGATDCGYEEGRLLVNTGCFVVDLRMPWVDAVDQDGYMLAYFTIRDRIRVIVLPDGSKVRTVEVAPEDWNFSRMLQQLGYKVRATRRVHLFHIGDAPFNNAEPWGACEQDKLLAHRHGGKRIGDGRFFEQAVDVPGWLTHDEGAALAEFAKGRAVIEVGSYCGRSTVWLARTARVVAAVDTFDGRATPEPRNTLEDFKASLKKYNVTGNVHVYVGESRTAVPEVAGKFDAAFIDGDHSEAAVLEDVTLCAAKGCTHFAFHDSSTETGVAAALAKLRADGYEDAGRRGTVAFLRRKQ